MNNYKAGDKVVLSTPSDLYGEGVIVCKLVDAEGFSVDFGRLEGGIENLWLTEDEIKPVEPTVRTLHDSAMAAAEEAHMRYLEAYRKERTAFEIVAKLPTEGREPTFSILCSSAAWLAFKADIPHSAIELAERGLKEGKPSNYHRHGLEWCVEWSKRMIEERG